MDARPVEPGMSMQLKLYDTLSREKRPFEPLDRARVRVYVCGPTVYDFAHIGNARPAIVFDVLFRLLRHLYGERAVTYVRNITDVDDKINARAAERGVPIRAVTEETLKNYQEDVAALGCLPPTVEPRATEHIGEMKTLIERLVTSKHAYVAEEHVLFSVPSMPDYGRLSKRPLDEMIAGARVDVAPYKRDPMDFVLWKPSKPGEPAWPSPAGISTPGRPGWHIECSAMAWKHLGETFDIHGGGVDLVFPHHENEVAQSLCAFHTSVMANYWMHNGFLQVEGEKMSKSLGNFVTMRELLAQQPNNRWWGEILRFNMLRTHYRQPIDWTQASLNESLVIYSNLQRAVALANRSRAKPSEAVLAALADDLNTPAVIAELHKLAVNAQSPSGTPADAAAELLGSLLLLGFERAVEHAKSDGIREDILRAIQEVKARERGLDPASLDEQTAARTAARKAKNFAEADRIRDELAATGVVLKDSKEGTTWEVAR
jgi:cysteinyl-tRNA synthetase